VVRSQPGQIDQSQPMAQYSGWCLLSSTMILVQEGPGIKKDLISKLTNAERAGHLPIKYKTLSLTPNTNSLCLIKVFHLLLNLKWRWICWGCFSAGVGSGGRLIRNRAKLQRNVRVRHELSTLVFSASKLNGTLCLS
jgi:hypothetical protein